MIKLLERLLEIYTAAYWGFIAKSGEIITPDSRKYRAHEDYAFEWLKDKYGGEKEDYSLHKFYDETGYIRFSIISTKGYSEIAVWTWGDITTSQFKVISKMDREYEDFSFYIYRKGRILYGGMGFLDFREAIKRLGLLI